MEGGPDWVDIKDRDTAYSWYLTDSEQGTGHHLRTDSTDGAASYSNGITSFNADGYTLGPDTGGFNAPGDSLLDLCLKAGVAQGFYQEANIIHTAGTATSIAHNLGSAVTFGIVKRTDDTGGWYVFHIDLGTGKYLFLNETDAAVTSAGFWSTNTSTTFDIPSSLATGTYVAYLFTDSDIFKAFSYDGNLTEGPFVDLRGKPLAILFLKKTNAAGNEWHTFDAARNPFNPVAKTLYPNTTGVEYDPENDGLLFTSSGFKVSSTRSGLNANERHYVGLAILESTKYANAF